MIVRSVLASYAVYNSNLVYVLLPGFYSRMKLIAYLLAATLTLPGLTLAAPASPEIAAKSYFLGDVQSGQTLASFDADKRIEPASLTKLMTAYLTFQALKEGKLKPDQMLTVSQAGWKVEGSRMFLDPKVPVKVDDLIKGMIVQSGNDACITLAEGIAGNEQTFVMLMNEQAQKMGLKNTHFENSAGLPGAQHYSTAHDLALLAEAIIRDFPEYYPIYSMKSFAYNNITQPNRNLLLYRDSNVDGMKTGHTESAGFNLIASSKRGGRRVLSVVVGTTSPEARATESSKLLNWGLQFFDTPQLYKANVSVKQVKVYKGKENEISVGFLRDVYVTVDKGTANQLVAQLTANQPLIAPIKKGQSIGVLQVMQNNKVIAEIPAVALQDVEEAGFFGRLWDSLKLWLGW